ncbi:hypothetical protein MN033_09535 [Bacillus nitratireducens]|uniref:hypothetical protein n=1 Tax=Bacillus nitratireducens TaxID=2026193 RepID=UPI001F5A89BB|nr:hypothetical protein [Bacillus nitratireducens]UNP78395.1 hypothetical protein MN033_09535 [Bacillus nitratireducens]
MAYYEDEIKKDLQVGETYTEREIASIIYFDVKGSLVICDSISQFNSSGNRKFKVDDRLEQYVHQHIGDSYRIPSEKSKVFVVKQV